MLYAAPEAEDALLKAVKARRAITTVLLGLSVQCMLLAESAVLLDLETIRHVLLFFHCIVVSLLAFCTSQCNSCAHDVYLRSFFPKFLVLTAHFSVKKRGIFRFLGQKKRPARCH